MKGLQIPVGVNKSGGTATSIGDEQDLKIINLALASDSNENAYQQDIGLGQGMIFHDNGPRVKGEILRRITKIFNFFESQKRFKLMTDTITWEEDSENQSLVLEFYYLNIESDELRPFSRNFSQAV